MPKLLCFIGFGVYPERLYPGKSVNYLLPLMIGAITGLLLPDQLKPDRSNHSGGHRNSSLFGRREEPFADGLYGRFVQNLVPQGFLDRHFPHPAIGPNFNFEENRPSYPSNRARREQTGL